MDLEEVPRRFKKNRTQQNQDGRGNAKMYQNKSLVVCRITISPSRMCPGPFTTSYRCGPELTWVSSPHLVTKTGVSFPCISLVLPVLSNKHPEQPSSPWPFKCLQAGSSSRDIKILVKDWRWGGEVTVPSTRRTGEKDQEFGARTRK